jgi:hypothetical protein
LLNQLGDGEVHGTAGRIAQRGTATCATSSATSAALPCPA